MLVCLFSDQQYIGCVNSISGVQLSIPFDNAVQCTTEVLGETDVEIRLTGPGGVPQGTQSFNPNEFSNFLLFIPSIQQSHSGMYTCRVVVRGNTSVTQSFQLNGECKCNELTVATCL